jgi:hypothetical protein
MALTVPVLTVLALMDLVLMVLEQIGLMEADPMDQTLTDLHQEDALEALGIRPWLSMMNPCKHLLMDPAVKMKVH